MMSRVCAEFAETRYGIEASAMLSISKFEPLA
jgi:hypothetical protein